MVSDSPAARVSAERLGAALGELERRLDQLEPDASPGLTEQALAEPIRALSAAAREAVS
jgi:hypothetical protein